MTCLQRKLRQNTSAWVSIIFVVEESTDISWRSAITVLYCTVLYYAVLHLIACEMGAI